MFFTQKMFGARILNRKWLYTMESIFKPRILAKMIPSAYSDFPDKSDSSMSEDLKILMIIAR